MTPSSSLDSSNHIQHLTRAGAGIDKVFCCSLLGCSPNTPQKSCFPKCNGGCHSLHSGWQRGCRMQPTCAVPKYAYLKPGRITLQPDLRLLPYYHTALVYDISAVAFLSKDCCCVAGTDHRWCLIALCLFLFLFRNAPNCHLSLQHIPIAWSTSVQVSRSDCPLLLLSKHLTASDHRL